MNKYSLLAGLIILSISIMSCKKIKYDKQMPSDFSFNMTETTDSYNSKTRVYTRDYAGKDSSVVVSLTPEEMQLIYNSFVSCDFMSLPDEFECAEGASTHFPALDTSIEISYKGIRKTVHNSTYCREKAEQKKADRFDKFSSTIYKILSNKQKIKNMRECDIEFL